MDEILCKGYHVFIKPKNAKVMPDILVCTCMKMCLIRAAEQRDEADGELADKAPKELRTED